MAKVKFSDSWRPVTKDGHAIEKGDWLTNRNGGIEEVYKVDEEGAWTQEVIFEDDESDNYHLEPQTYITRQELRHYEYN